jgi:hypothetical protein
MMHPQHRERIEERKKELSSMSSQSDLTLQDLSKKQRTMHMRSTKKPTVLRKRKSAKRYEIRKPIKNYKEEPNAKQDIETKREVESESDINKEEDICITLDYFVDQRESSIRLMSNVYLKSANDPTSTDRIAVGAKNAEEYTKWISTIKALPNSLKKNIPINEYKKLVNKYTLLMKRILENEEEDKEYVQDLLNNNIHIKNFKNYEKLEKYQKITFEFFESKKEKDYFSVDFIFHLNDHFKFKNAKFDDLPIKYVISSTKEEIYGIWFDQSLEKQILRHQNVLFKRSELFEF